MKRIVPINGVGKVAFPDSMSDSDVQQATEKLGQQNQQQQTVGLSQVLQHLVSQEPQGGNSQSYAKVSEVAKVLEQSPALLSLASAGLRAGNGAPPADSTSQVPQPPASQPSPQAANASGSPT